MFPEKICIFTIENMSRSHAKTSRFITFLSKFSQILYNYCYCYYFLDIQAFRKCSKCCKSILSRKDLKDCVEMRRLATCIQKRQSRGCEVACSREFFRFLKFVFLKTDCAIKMIFAVINGRTIKVRFGSPNFCDKLWKKLVFYTLLMFYFLYFKCLL